MILMLQCGKLTDEERKTVQAALDKMPGVTDWYRYMENCWFIETAHDPTYIRDEIRACAEDTNLFVTPLHYYNGFMNKNVWEWLKGRELVPTPKPRASQNNNNDRESDVTELGNLIEVTDAPALEQFIGMEQAITQLRQQIAGIGFRAAARQAGLKLDTGFYNILLSGPAGVGKTSLAQSAAFMLKDNMADTRKRPIYLVQAADLVGRHTGKSANNTKHVLRAAGNGILILDEIDTLLDIAHYGEEVLNTLNTHIGLSPNKPVIIGTLYDSREKDLRNTNRGLSSRFPYVQRLPSYDDATLTQIFRARVEGAGLTLTDGAEKELAGLIGKQRNTLGKNFGNAREVENIYHATIDILAARYMEMPEALRHAFAQGEDSPERQEALQSLSQVTPADIPVRDSRSGALMRRAGPPPAAKGQQQAGKILGFPATPGGEKKDGPQP